MSWCRKCGTALKEGIKFCAKCGTPVAGNISSIKRRGDISPEQGGQCSNVVETNNITQKASCEKKQNSTLIIGLVSLLVLGGLGGGYYYMKLNNVPEASTAIQTQAKDRQNESVVTEKSVSSKANNPASGAETTLSIGGIIPGMSKEEVEKKLGKAISSKNVNNSVRCNYPNIDIIYKNNYVIGIETNGKYYATDRGIKEGSKYEDVMKLYGNDYEKSRYEQYVLYEYTQGNTILRFAMKQGYVDYISLRKNNC